MLTERRLLESATRRLRDLLLDSTGFELLEEVPSGSADALWILNGADRQVRLAVEVKGSVLPRDVPLLAVYLERSRQEVRADRSVVVSSSFTPRSRELLRDLDINYVDERGNIRLVLPGSVVITATESRPSTGAPSSPDRIANPFRGKASRLVRALLADPSRWWQVTELAKRVDVSAGLAAKTLSSLDEDAYIQRDRKRRVQLRDGERLLRRWAEVSANQFKRSARFTSASDDPDKITAQVSAAFSRVGSRYAVTRLAAARFLEPFAPAAVVDVYVEDEPAVIGETLGLFPVERGESVRLVRPNDPGAFQFNVESSGVALVHPVQLYVDLLNGAGREPDVAERLLVNQIRPTFVAEISE